MPCPHKVQMDILKKIYKESSEYFRREAIRKQQQKKLLSLNELYRRESERRFRSGV